MMEVKQVHDEAGFKKFLKDSKAKVSDFKIFNEIEWIDPNMPHSWQNVRLELVSAKLRMYVKLRLGACY